MSVKPEKKLLKLNFYKVTSLSIYLSLNTSQNISIGLGRVPNYIKSFSLAPPLYIEIFSKARKIILRKNNYPR